MREITLAFIAFWIVGNAAVAIAALWHISVYTLPDWTLPKKIIPLYLAAFLILATFAVFAAIQLPSSL